MRCQETLTRGTGIVGTKCCLKFCYRARSKNKIFFAKKLHHRCLTGFWIVKALILYSENCECCRSVWYYFILVFREKRFPQQIEISLKFWWLRNVMNFVIDFVYSRTFSRWFINSNCDSFSLLRMGKLWKQN